MKKIEIFKNVKFYRKIFFSNMIFFDLPTELQTYIYEFDSTYHSKFHEVLEEILVSMNPHRYYEINEQGHIVTDEYITPKNLNLFMNNKFSDFGNNRKENLKELLNDSFSTNKRLDIIIQKDDTRTGFALNLPEDISFMQRNTILIHF